MPNPADPKYRSLSVFTPPEAARNAEIIVLQKTAVPPTFQQELWFVALCRNLARLIGEKPSMMPRTAIAQIAKMIGRELDTGAGPSEEALAAGPTLAEAGAATEIVGSLLAEAHRKRPDDRMVAGYSFLLEGALGTLRLRSSGGDIGAARAIAELRHLLDDALKKGGVAPKVLMLMARTFARAELDPGRTLQQAMMTAMEAQSPSIPAALTPAEISDHFAELAAALDNDLFEIYAELAITAAAFPAEHHAAMAGTLAMSDSEAVQEAALGFALSPDPR